MRQYIIIAMMTFALGSCKSFLEEEVYSTYDENSVFSTAETAEMAVEGIYGNLTSGNAYGNNIQQLAIYGTDEARCHFSGSTNSYYYDISNYSHTASDTKITNAWKALYAGIGKCNDVYWGVEAMTNIDNSVKERLQAETLFFRAFFYFNLVQLWGGVRVNTTDPDMGSITTTDIKRESVADVYRQILSDIEIACANLPDSPARNGRVGKVAANALLAKIYLTMASGQNFNVEGYTFDYSSKELYTMAKELLYSVMTTSGLDLEDEYADIFSLNNKYNQEIIFCASYSSSGPGTSYPQLGGPSTPSSGDLAYGQSGLGGRNYMRPTTYLALIVYDDSETLYNINNSTSAVTGIKDLPEYDKRLYHNIINRQISSSYLYSGNFDDDRQNYTNVNGVSNVTNPVNYGAYKFNLRLHKPDGYTTGSSPMNLPIIRYADILLMYAEAAGMLNLNDQSLYDAWNRVRQRAKSDTAPAGVLDDIVVGDFATADEFLTSLLQERMRELCFEGHRRFDLLRTNRLFRAINEMGEAEASYIPYGYEGYATDDLYSNFVSQQVDYDYDYTAAATNLKEFHKLFPIPQSEMNVIGSSNPNYRQNTGY